MKKHYIIFSIVFLMMTKSYGQQQVMFTQYMFNATAINPAVVGTHETLSLTALTRHQWVGIEGAPNTQTISLHAPIKKNKLGVGALLLRDEIGVSAQTAVFGAIAYRVNFAKSTLSMGLQLGFTDYRSEFLSLDPNNSNGIDNSLFSNVTNSFLPNIGAGLYYYTDRFYAGVSSPLLLNNFLDDNLGDINPENKRADLERHYFAMAGFIVDLSPYLKLKPSALLKVVEGAPIEMDFNANLLINEVFWVGLSYRSFDSFSILLEIQASEKFRFGYAYDLAVSDLGPLTSGSHEIMLNYRFSFKKNRILTPRYF